MRLKHPVALPVLTLTVCDLSRAELYSWLFQCWWSEILLILLYRFAFRGNCFHHMLWSVSSCWAVSSCFPASILFVLRYQVPWIYIINTKELEPNYVRCTICFCSDSFVLQEAKRKFCFPHIWSLPDQICLVQIHLQIHSPSLKGKSKVLWGHIILSSNLTNVLRNLSASDMLLAIYR